MNKVKFDCQEGTVTLNLMVPSNSIIVEDKLGSGSYGNVYKGKMGHNTVAIKEIYFNHTFKEKSLAEFNKEVLIMAQLGSQCQQLVRLIGVCCEMPCRIIMEFLTRGSLYDVLRSNNLGPNWLLWKETISIAKDIAIGLEFLHNHQVLHRDIKSMNILLDQQWRAKISDYGLAKVKLISSSNNSMGIVGTLPWLAPELLVRSSNGSPAQYTTSSDIYSYGLVLWEMASYLDPKIPYSYATNVGFLLREILAGIQEPIAAGTPIYFKKLIDACRNINPVDRPQIKEIISQLSYDQEVAPLKPMAARIFEIEKDVSEINPPCLSSADFGTNDINQISSVDYAAFMSSQTLLFSKSACSQSQRFTLLAQSDLSPTVQQELFKFLKHISHGEQNEAEEMLKIRPKLSSMSGIVIDCAERKFEGITGLQYAVWSLDYYMWSMIINYLSEEQIQAQLEGLDYCNWVYEHGKQVSWQQLIDALEVYVKEVDNWSWEEACNYWCHTVGRHQLMLPACMINEYNHPLRSFANYSEEYNVKEFPRMELSTWKIGLLGGGRLGENFAWYRGAGELGPTEGTFTGDKSWVELDLRALKALYEVRRAQTKSLTLIKSELTMVSGNSVVAKLQF